eukprot:1463085-Rhodomonas_salina.1
MNHRHHTRGDYEFFSGFCASNRGVSDAQKRFLCIHRFCASNRSVCDMELCTCSGVHSGCGEHEASLMRNLDGISHTEPVGGTPSRRLEPANAAATLRASLHDSLSLYQYLSNRSLLLLLDYTSSPPVKLDHGPHGLCAALGSCCARSCVGARGAGSGKGLRRGDPAAGRAEVELRDQDVDADVLARIALSAEGVEEGLGQLEEAFVEEGQESCERDREAAELGVQREGCDD